MPVASTRDPAAALAFPSRGFRRKPDGGLTYRSKCKRFALHCGDQVGGVRMKVVRWLAIELLGNGSERIISRHYCRAAAIDACRRRSRHLN